jgi:hypothetical protein
LGERERERETRKGGLEKAAKEKKNTDKDFTHFFCFVCFFCPFLGEKEEDIFTFFE